MPPRIAPGSLHGARYAGSHEWTSSSTCSGSVPPTERRQNDGILLPFSGNELPTAESPGPRFPRGRPVPPKPPLLAPEPSIASPPHGYFSFGAPVSFSPVGAPAPPDSLVVS